MAPAEFLYSGNDVVELVQFRDDGIDHRHQLAPLLDGVALEQWPQRGIHFEQLAVEQLGGLFLDRHHLLPGALYQGDLLRCHGIFLYLIIAIM
ncbi:hypothetical protein D3C87_1855670 [compost metagenome]